jgi:hypothetical protein
MDYKDINMSDNITIAIIGVIGVFIASIATLLNTKYKYTLESKKPIPLLAFLLKKLLICLRGSTKADSITFSRFHNGGHFIDGVSMDKFSVLQEDCSEGLNYVQNDFQAVLMSRFAQTMHELLFNKSILQSNINNLKDHNLRSYLNKQKIKSIYMFLVEDIKCTPIGFITIAYMNEYNMENEDILLITNNITKINNLLNNKEDVSIIEEL